MDTDKKTALGDGGDKLSVAEGQWHTSGLNGLNADLRPGSLAQLADDDINRLNKKLVRKIDLFILPPIGILYILNYIDRQNLSAAKLQGIMEDLNMTTEQFATAVSILFVGYLPFQIVSCLFTTSPSGPLSS